MLRTKTPRASGAAHLSHELLGGEDQLVVDEPAGLLLEQGAVGVDVDRLLVLHRLVAALTEPSRVVEVPGRHRLGDTAETASGFTQHEPAE